MWTTPYTPDASYSATEVRWPLLPGKKYASVEEKVAIGISIEANRPPPWWSNIALDERNRLDEAGKWIQNYFVLYALIGIFMFCNHLPWT